MIGIKAIAKGMSESQSLSSVFLRFNPLGEQGVSLLASSLPSRIVHLDISGTGAGDEGINALAQEISNGSISGLNVLKICGCSAGPSSIAKLLEAFEESSINSLDLDISGNNMGKGDSVLIDKILSSSKLSVLRLHDCNLGSGMELLISRMQLQSATLKNHGLKDLDLSGNNIPEDCTVKFLDALASLPDVMCHLQSLVIAANIGVEGENVGSAVERVQNTRQNLCIIRTATDTGETQRA